ncbi:sporulation histidine kinase inhibitor Sda [Siminovitchia acidinfaciens]|uniref:Sporulation histidine kinase inhibitor Sda n=1 Tax=Siminovitchia acidinfaciens TaxID=2321395 RepID=A0A429XZB3_9BACI|nr:sporulation histidine kinase inhibitor Sda [Siminovitchia acidinfaciens]RST74112.1 sporulation histidine kinase inhibitor Sda [Siminovitchia acidinfaciens]
MNRLSDNLLITSYQKAIEINEVDPFFISLLQKEIERRKLESYDHNSFSCYIRSIESVSLNTKKKPF